MSDTMVWNLLVAGVCGGGLLAGVVLSCALIKFGVSVRDTLKIVIAVIGISAFIFLAGTDKIKSDVAAGIMGALLGFATGWKVTRSN